MNLETLRQRMLYQTLLLGGAALLVSALLGLGNHGTAGLIAERNAGDLRDSLSEVLPARHHDNDLLADTVTVPRDDEPVLAYRGRLEGRVNAVAFAMDGVGYGGPIRVLLGVDRTGRVLGVRVLSHSETPGLGDGIERAKSDWVLDFDDKRLGNPPPGDWTVQKDGGVFDQFTGATITPRATVAIVRDGLEFFAAHRARLLHESPPETPIATLEHPHP